MRIWMVGLLALWMSWAQAAQPVRTEPPLAVVASFSILGDMVREVGGEDVAVQVIVGPMQDAHTAEPTPQDARALASARVLVVNGLGFEAWLPRLLEASGFKGQTVVASRGVKPRLLAPGDDAHGHETAEDHAAHAPGAQAPDSPESVDPHAWQDLANGVQYVQNIAQGLAQADPAHASAYFARADAYIRKIRRADAKWRAALSAVPPTQRVLATSHDAFGYFATAYGIRVLSIVGVSAEAEPSARVMADLIQQIRGQHIRALFLEHGSTSRALEQIARETGVALGGTLYADTLARAGDPADTYLGMFRWNTGLMLKAFEAPAAASVSAESATNEP